MHIIRMDSRIGIAALFFLCMAWQAQAQTAANCTAAGRFANTNDDTCQSYYLCAYNPTTLTYVAYNYTCPTTSVFNPNTAQCTIATNYNCTNTNATTTSVCTTNGYIADPTVTDCSSYIECTDIDGTFVETTYSCPTDTFYNPTTTLCESDYVCTYTCTAAGRFANTADATCQTYYFCVYVATNATYVQYEYTCPTTSVFNPTSQMCTTAYVCGS